MIFASSRRRSTTRGDHALKDTSQPRTATSRIGVEIGGTFTDLVWIDGEGRLRTGKTPSTPSAIHEAVLGVIETAGVPLASVSQVTHGSTVATNSLLTRRGARTGLLTTRGFRDVVILGRADRDHSIYDMRYRRPVPPIRRSMIRELAERIGPDGEVMVPLDLESAWTEARALIEEGVEAIAICLLHAYRNPEHEQRLAALIRERAPNIVVSASHEVSPEFREYERSLTTVANAFVGPVVERYVNRLADGLRERGHEGVMHIMQSNGGCMPAAAAGSNAVRMLLSGPAAGIRAAMWFAERNGVRDVITLDMGGTSTDVAIAPGLKPGTVPELRIDGLPVRTASIDMGTIGAGGGSIAQIDRGGFLAVGPDSAGAEPGPACYGRGGERPTVTDAQMVSGLLRPKGFQEGKLALSRDLAEAALATLKMEAGIEASADAILRLVNSNMADAVRLVSTRRGIDPRDFAIVAYGGGGPLHAAMVAEELGVRQVLIPWSPGLASAFGLLIADTVIDLSRSAPQPLSERTLNDERLRQLQAQAGEAARLNGLDDGSYEVAVGLDMRYAGQAFELPVWTASGTADVLSLRGLFETEHRSRYGHARPGIAIEVTGYRMRIIRRSREEVATPLVVRGGSETFHDVRMNGMKARARVLGRGSLAPGDTLDGPAILEEATSTTVVPPGWTCDCLESGDLLLRSAQ